MKFLNACVSVAALVTNIVPTGVYAGSLSDPVVEPQVIPTAVCSTGKGQKVVTVGSSTYYPVTMRRVAEEVRKDPTGIWGNRIRNFNNPNGTDIWVGSLRVCDDTTLTFSQFVNRQCSSQDTCPMRVLAREANNDEDRIVLKYEQACTDHETWFVRTDGRGVMTCNEQFFWKRSRTISD